MGMARFLRPVQPPSGSAPVLDVDTNPLQKAGAAPRLRRVVYGGPVCGFDVRVYLDRHVIRDLLAQAEQSVTGRVRIDRAALLVELRRGLDGHPYEVWTLISGAPGRPEPGPFGEDPGTPPPWPEPPPVDPIGRQVQLASGAGVVLRRTLYGDPVDGDARVFLDAHILRLLLDRAGQALSGRAQLDNVGLVVDDHVDGDGRLFEVWTFNANGDPRPEPDRMIERGG